MRIQNN